MNPLLRGVLYGLAITAAVAAVIVTIWITLR